MAVSPKCLLEPSLLTTSTFGYYAVNKGVTIIDKMTLVNTSSTLFIIVSVYLVPSGITLSNTHAIIKSFTLSPNETYEVAKAEGHVLNIGDSIHAIAGTGSLVSFRVSGREVAV